MGVSDTCPSCAVCSASIAAGALYVPRATGCMCEACALGAVGAIPAGSAVDAAYIALAESLAAALDAREHETGLHSKRVIGQTV